MKLNFSNFLKTKQKKEITAIFHALHPSPIYIATKVWKLLKTNPEKVNKELIKALKKQQLIVQSDKEDNKKLKQIRTE